MLNPGAKVIKEDLNQTELKAFEIIKNKSNNGFISRYILEGELLYGDLKLSNITMYHLIIELENKGLIKKKQMKDGGNITHYNLFFQEFLFYTIIYSILLILN